MTPAELKKFNFVSQTSHLGCAGAIILALHLFIGMTALYCVTIGLIGLCAWKEFYYDQHYETAEIRGSNLEDFSFYVGGMLVAFILIWIK